MNKIWLERSYIPNNPVDLIYKSADVIHPLWIHLHHHLNCVEHIFNRPIA